MKALLLILLFLILQLNGYSQKGDDSDLLKIFGYTFIDMRPAYLYSGGDTTALKMLKEYLKGEKLRGDNPKRITEPSETLFLSKSERKSLDSQLNSTWSYKWTKASIQKCGIFHLQVVGEEVYNKRHRIEQYVYEIMRPIFIREGTICFTYYYISCQGRCGVGAIDIHKRVKGKWQAWISVARFTS